MVIRILSHVPYCYGSSEGEIIRRLIADEFRVGRGATLSFDGVSEVTSSFVNTALVSLLEVYSYEFIRSHLRIIHTRRQVSEMIARRFKFEVTKLSAA